MSKILIIDDNADMLLTLEHLLQFYEFDVVKAENGRLGVDAAVNEQPDLIIVDALMPVMNGFEACGILKSQATTNQIPVIFLSANYTAPEHRRKGMEMGADDYMLKPFNAKELITKVNSLLHRQRLIASLREENSQLIGERLTRRQGLQLPPQDQRLDATTGLLNQQLLGKVLETQLPETPALAENLSISLTDIDQFSDIQEMFGEQTADYVLLKVGNLILRNSREGDLVFRPQGNRYAILHPGISEDTAFNTTSHILNLIRSQPIFDEDFFAIKRSPQRRRYDRQELTLSAGVAGLQSSDSGPQAMAQAGEALDLAKKTGRNKVVRFRGISNPL
ncbi:MAG TPA: response regulator [Calditrichia bacterium]|nr:response regulator [Calditrichota bacterium]HQV31527.1 response regulator [Calditrichia bacterium]